MAQRNRKVDGVNRIRKSVEGVGGGRCWLTHKLMHPDFESAAQALQEVREKRLKRKQNKRGIENRVYFHEICGAWHLTHMTAEELEAEREKWGHDDEE